MSDATFDALRSPGNVDTRVNTSVVPIGRTNEQRYQDVTAARQIGNESRWHPSQMLKGLSEWGRRGVGKKDTQSVVRDTNVVVKPQEDEHAQRISQGRQDSIKTSSVDDDTTPETVAMYAARLEAKAKTKEEEADQADAAEAEKLRTRAAHLRDMAIAAKVAGVIPEVKSLVAESSADRAVRFRTEAAQQADPTERQRLLDKARRLEESTQDSATANESVAERAQHIQRFEDSHEAAKAIEALGIKLGYGSTVEGVLAQLEAKGGEAIKGVDVVRAIEVAQGQRMLYDLQREGIEITAYTNPDNVLRLLQNGDVFTLTEDVNTVKSYIEAAVNEAKYREEKNTQRYGEAQEKGEKANRQREVQEERTRRVAEASTTIGRIRQRGREAVQGVKQTAKEWAPAVSAAAVGAAAYEVAAWKLRQQGIDPDSVRNSVRAAVMTGVPLAGRIVTETDRFTAWGERHPVAYNRVQYALSLATAGLGGAAAAAGGEALVDAVQDRIANGENVDMSMLGIDTLQTSDERVAALAGDLAAADHERIANGEVSLEEQQQNMMETAAVRYRMGLLSKEDFVKVVTVVSGGETSDVVLPPNTSAVEAMESDGFLTQVDGVWKVSDKGLDQLGDAGMDVRSNVIVAAIQKNTPEVVSLVEHNLINPDDEFTIAAYLQNGVPDELKDQIAILDAGGSVKDTPTAVSTQQESSIVDASTDGDVIQRRGDTGGEPTDSEQPVNDADKDNQNDASSQETADASQADTRVDTVSPKLQPYIGGMLTHTNNELHLTQAGTDMLQAQDERLTGVDDAVIMHNAPAVLAELNKDNKDILTLTEDERTEFVRRLSRPIPVDGDSSVASRVADDTPIRRRGGLQEGAPGDSVAFGAEPVDTQGVEASGDTMEAQAKTAPTPDTEPPLPPTLEPYKAMLERNEDGRLQFSQAGIDDLQTRAIHPLTGESLLTEDDNVIRYNSPAVIREIEAGRLNPNNFADQQQMIGMLNQPIPAEGSSAGTGVPAVSETSSQQLQLESLLKGMLVEEDGQYKLREGAAPAIAALGIDGVSTESINQALGEMAQSGVNPENVSDVASFIERNLSPFETVAHETGISLPEGMTLEQAMKQVDLVLQDGTVDEKEVQAISQILGIKLDNVAEFTKQMNGAVTEFSSLDNPTQQDYEKLFGQLQTAAEQINIQYFAANLGIQLPEGTTIATVTKELDSLFATGTVTEQQVQDISQTLGLNVKNMAALTTHINSVLSEVGKIEDPTQANYEHLLSSLQSGVEQVNLDALAKDLGITLPEGITISQVIEKFTTVLQNGQVTEQDVTDMTQSLGIEVQDITKLTDSVNNFVTGLGALENPTEQNLESLLSELQNAAEQINTEKVIADLGITLPEGVTMDQVSAQLDKILQTGTVTEADIQVLADTLGIQVDDIAQLTNHINGAMSEFDDILQNPTAENYEKLLGEIQAGIEQINVTGVLQELGVTLPEGVTVDEVVNLFDTVMQAGQVEPSDVKAIADILGIQVGDVDAVTQSLNTILKDIDQTVPVDELYKELVSTLQSGISEVSPELHPHIDAASEAVGLTDTKPAGVEQPADTTTETPVGTEQGENENTTTEVVDTESEAVAAETATDATEPVDERYAPLPETIAKNGAVVEGSVVDGTLTYDGKEWHIFETGVQRIHDLAEKYGITNLTIDEERYKQVLQHGVSEWARGELDPLQSRDERDLWLVRMFSDDVTAYRGKLENDITLMTMRNMGIIRY